MKKEKVCVYTCITGDYDNLQSLEKEEGIDYICFTNNIHLQSKDWKLIYIEDTDGLGNALLSRKIKILGHTFVEQNYDISIWVDGAIQIKGKITQFLNTFCQLEKYDMACFKHRMRDCVYEEAVACIIHRKANVEDIKEYLEFMEQEKYPRHNGLAECTVLIRRHNKDLVQKTMEMWFELLCRYARRDQLTFPYCIYKTRLPVCWIDLNVFDNPWFFWKAHKQREESFVARIFFGQYKNVYEDSCFDVCINQDDKKYKVNFVVPKSVNKVSVNLGKHFGKAIRNIKIDGVKASVTCFPGIVFEEYIIFDYDDLVIYLEGDFIQGKKVIISFEIIKVGELNPQVTVEDMVDKYYYDKLIRDNMIDYLNKKREMLEDTVVTLAEIQETPLFSKLRPLCEHQDLKTKIIRKLVLKLIR